MASVNVDLYFKVPTLLSLAHWPIWVKTGTNTISTKKIKWDNLSKFVLYADVACEIKIQKALSLDTTTDWPYLEQYTKTQNWTKFSYPISPLVTNLPTCLVFTFFQFITNKYKYKDKGRFGAHYSWIMTRVAQAWKWNFEKG